MRKIGEVLRLKAEGFSDRQIAMAIGSARSKVQECIRRARQAGLCWPLPTEVDESALHARLYRRGMPLSRTYLDWARRNMEINGFRGEGHRFVQADCLQWIAEDDGERYDLIFLDPPTFSNSKRMQREFDVQRDQRIHHCFEIRLAP